MKKTIYLNISMLFLMFCTCSLSAQFLTKTVSSLEIKTSIINDSLSITAGAHLINGYGNLDNPSIVSLKQNSQYFCFILQTEKKTKQQSYTKHYLFAGVKDIANKQIVLDYQMFPLTLETSINSLIVIDPVIIDPITILLNYAPAKGSILYNNENTKTSAPDKIQTILRLTASGIVRYIKKSSGGRLFFNDTRNIRTNEN